MSTVHIAAVVVAALWVAGLLLAWLHPLPDKPYAADLPAERPGRDDQWSAFCATVPNIRKAALTEQEVELAWHPASRDTPVPSRFRRFGQHLLDTSATEQFPVVLAGPYQGRHRTTH